MRSKMVERTLATYPVIVAAVHVPACSQVRFACVDQEGTGGTSRVLVYDYDINQWFVWKYDNGMPISDLAVHRGKMVIASPQASGHKIWREDSGFDDPSGFVPATLETGDIRLAGSNGYQSLYTVSTLGRHQGNASITVSVSTDSGSSFPEDSAWNLNDSAEADAQRTHYVETRKSGHHRLRLVVGSTTTTDTAGPRLYGFTLEGQPLRRVNRLQATSRS